jgi:hypothetical protein
MGNQQVSRSNAKLTVARMEVRKVSRHLTACVLPETVVCGMYVVVACIQNA